MKETGIWSIKAFATLLIVVWMFEAGAASILPVGTDAHLSMSDAVCRGTVVEVSSYRNSEDLQIYTKAFVRVDEVFKGTFPAVVRMVHRGGTVDGEGDSNGFSPLLHVGEERVFFLTVNPDGTLGCTQGGASAVRVDSSANRGEAQAESLLEILRDRSQSGAIPGRDVTGHAGAESAAARSAPPSEAGGVGIASVTGLLVDGFGTAARFLLPDRGEPIPYLVDADSLPAGITLSQALGAVESALAAWSGVTSLKFKFDGVQSFGMAAPNVIAQDGRLRIQLHDNYNYINSPTTLGIGGRSHKSPLLAPVGWGTGGSVNGNEFHETVRGYVVLERTNTAMQVLATFAEVLCHEIGHALTMGHSSEDPSETDPVKKEAMMYFRAHADGRGATLGSYDPPIIQQVHPTDNTPPYAYPRVMDVTTDSPSQPNVAGINEIELRGYDLQGAGLSLATVNGTANAGAFSLSGNTLKYTPSGFFNAARLDPAGNSFYDQIVARHSDGTNASPYVGVRVISLSPDNFPGPVGDGIPDSWMITHFGSADPAAGPNRNANDDFDGDGLTNKEEYLAGTDPKNASSAQRITAFSLESLQWQAKPYELYELHSTSDLVTWARAVNPLIPTNNPGTATGYATNQPQLLFRVEKVP